LYRRDIVLGAFLFKDAINWLINKKNKFLNLSRLATYGMKQLPADVLLQIQSNTLWSKEEEGLLAKTSAVCHSKKFFS
jgi:hypothetical protein